MRYKHEQRTRPLTTLCLGLIATGALSGEPETLALRFDPTREAKAPWVIELSAAARLLRERTDGAYDQEAAGSPPVLVPLAQAVKRLYRKEGDAFVVFTRKEQNAAGETTLVLDTLYVLPQVIEINRRGGARPASAAQGPPGVSLVPSKDGGPPMIKFELDPNDPNLSQ